MTHSRLLTILCASITFLAVACSHQTETRTHAAAESVGDDAENDAHRAGRAIDRTADHAEEETHEAVHHD